MIVTSDIRARQLHMWQGGEHGLPYKIQTYIQDHKTYIQRRHTPCPWPCCRCRHLLACQHNRRRSECKDNRRPAQSEKEPMQGVRRGEHLPAPLEKASVQGLRRRRPLYPAKSDKEQVQGVRTHCGGGNICQHKRERTKCKTCKAEKGRFHAAESRGALD